jgi:hypothetical protein
LTVKADTPDIIDKMTINLLLKSVQSLLLIIDLILFPNRLQTLAEALPFLMIALDL